MSVAIPSPPPPSLVPAPAESGTHLRRQTASDVRPKTLGPSDLMHAEQVGAPRRRPRNVHVGALCPPGRVFQLSRRWSLALALSGLAPASPGSWASRRSVPRCGPTRPRANSLTPTTFCASPPPCSSRSVASPPTRASPGTSTSHRRLALLNVQHAHAQLAGDRELMSAYLRDAMTPELRQRLRKARHSLVAALDDFVVGGER